MRTIALDDLDFGLRALHSSDRPILEEATRLNVNWEVDRFTMDEVLADPRLAHYTEIRPERGDFGFVATQEDRWAAVVWLVFLPADAPGYGFVSEAVPELSVCTQVEFRRRGVGRALIQMAFEEAVERGHRAISLSVEEGNPARHLYESMGFVNPPGEHKPGTMVGHLSTR